MPELPETEITTRKLRSLILGKQILDLGERKILRIERKGKAILIYLSGDKILGFHQRMTGKLLIVNRDFKDKHIRRRFRLSDGRDLAFHDVRKFGIVWYGSPSEVFGSEYFKYLGMDALAIRFEEFESLLKNRRSKIKPFLLNQKNLAGIGNIMADEILWSARIHPERKIKSLRNNEIELLWRALRSVLLKSIKLGGSTMRDWLHPDGKSGGYFEKRSVYDREGKKCFRCKSKIFRKKIAGRSSYYCKGCQRL